MVLIDTLQHVPSARPGRNQPVNPINALCVQIPEVFLHRRVCEVTLLGNHEFRLKQQKYKVSETLKTGEASALFGKPQLSLSESLSDVLFCC